MKEIVLQKKDKANIKPKTRGGVAICTVATVGKVSVWCLWSCEGDGGSRPRVVLCALSIAGYGNNADRKSVIYSAELNEILVPLTSSVVSVTKTN